MAGVICDDGIDALNSLLVAAMAAVPYQVGLFTNNHTPVVGDTFASYTEATFGGYARQNLATPTDSGTSSNINTQKFAGVTFTATGSGLPVTVYGYFIYSGSVLIGAELFAVAITLSAAGQGINVVPFQTYQDRSIP